MRDRQRERARERVRERERERERGREKTIDDTRKGHQGKKTNQRNICKHMQGSNTKRPDTPEIPLHNYENAVSNSFPQRIGIETREDEWNRFW